MRTDQSIARRDMLTVLGAGIVGILARRTDRSMELRRAVLPPLDVLARPLGSYTAYRLHEAEYVGSVGRDTGLELPSLGYERNDLSAVKYHPRTGEPDQGSWRRVDPERPRWQWHVHTWWMGDRIQVFSHYEYRPDPTLLDGESFADMRVRLREHYDPTWDIEEGATEPNYFLGRVCDRLRSRIAT